MNPIGFVAGTKVLTPEGLVPIEEITAGVEVTAAAPDEGGTRSVRVRSVAIEDEVPLVHVLYEAGRFHFLAGGWSQMFYAVGAESWVWDVETPGWVEAAEAPVDIFLRCSTDEPARLLQVAPVVRSSVPTRGFLQSPAMDQATGAWLDLSGPAPATIPYPGYLVNPRTPGLVVNDVDLDTFPVEQRSFRSTTYALSLSERLGYFVGDVPVLVMTRTGG